MMVRWKNVVVTALVIVIFYVLPTMAINGTISGLSSVSVTCANIDSQLDEEAVINGKYSCDGLSTTPSEVIITITGTPIRDCASTEPRQEIENNDNPASPQVIDASSSSCIGIEGEAASGMDIDVYQLTLPPGLQSMPVHINVENITTQFTVAIFKTLDDSGRNIELQGFCDDPGSRPKSCQRELNADSIIVIYPCLLNPPFMLSQCSKGSYRLNLIPTDPS
jgi:hypothetical protein